MAVELDAEQVERLPLGPVGRPPDAPTASASLGAAPGTRTFSAHAPAVAAAAAGIQQQVRDLEARLARKEIDGNTSMSTNRSSGVSRNA